MSGHTDNLEVIKSDAYRWILMAGGGAVLLSCFLAWADYTLSHSDYDRRLGETLRELRTAQSSMASGAVDSRILGASGNESGSK